MGWHWSKRSWKRVISLIAIVAMLFTMIPASLAEGEGEAATESPTVTPVAETATPEPTPEATPTPEITATPTSATDPTPSPDNTPSPDSSMEPTVTPEMTPTPELTPTPSPTPLPYGFTGMPVDYALSDSQMKAKSIMTDKGIVEATESLTPGEDYVSNQVMFWADSAEYAQMVTAAYNGVLISYSNNIALVELQTATVLEAMSVASDMTTTMPAIDANHIISVDPGESEAATKAPLDQTAAAAVPKQQSWFERPNDPFLQSPSASDYQWMHDAVNTYEAWGVTTGRSSVKVAVIDTGVLASHEELSGRVTSINMTDVTGESNDDTDGHGTHVAGIIAASSANGKGGAGIAPGVTILSLTALPGGSGNDAWVGYAVGRAVDSGADIINMSLGNYYYNSTLNAAIQNAINHNVSVIAAMGNDGSNSLCYPAAYNNVIAVAAVNSDYRRANFSNYGSWADIAAPGVGIMSSISESSASYSLMSGTSMATPVVAGVAALYLSKAGSVSPSALERKLESCVNRSDSGSIGAGVIDASKLFAADRIAPSIIIKDALGDRITNFSQPIPLESTLTIEGAAGSTNAKLILYTTDGTTPTITNGEVAKGIEYTGVVNLSSLPKGKAITIRALCVSGMGIVSNVASQTFTLGKSSTITEIQINGVDQITAGGQTTYTATVLPVESVIQTVNWQILSRTGAAKATISSTGVLKTVVGDGGSVTIRATSSVNAAKYKDIVVAVQAIPFVKTITLSAIRVVMNVRSGYLYTSDLSVLSVINALNASVDPDSLRWKWTSSNTKVATVEQSGEITAVGKGSANIICTALDGSNRTAICPVVVRQVSESISVAGQRSIAPGRTATYKATILPATVDVKTVAWSLVGAPTGVVISAAGVVSVPSSVTSGSFTVLATTTDGTDLSSSVDVNIAAMSTAISLTSSDTRVVKTTTGVITSAVLFPQNIDTTPVDDTVLQLGYSISGNSTTPVWTSSSPTIATVDQSGKVTALKLGTATITCTTQDGSGKSASMRISVNTPVQSITLAGQKSIPAGRTASYRATVLQNTASNKTLKWTIDGAPTGVTVSTGGTVSVPVTTTSGSFTVVATAADGSGVSGSFDVAIAPVSTAISLTSSDTRVVKTSTGVITGAVLFPQNIDTTSFDDTVLQLGASIVGNSTTPVWTSSSPTIATVDQSGKVTALKLGTTTITCATQDGSGKSASMRVSVNTPVQSITLAGQKSIAAGRSATYKATVLQNTASNKTLKWTIDGAPTGVTVSTGGTVSVSSAVTSGSFTVVATATDGSGVYGSYNFTIAAASTAISLTSSDSRVVRASGIITGATMFPFDVESTIVNDPELQLGRTIIGNSTAPVWSSSSPTIASVDQSGKVTALKAGTTTITCATQDGSGKSASMKITVIIPASYITVSSAAPMMMYSSPTIAFGKSCANTVTYGDTYGTPTVKKVTWSFVVFEVTKDRDYIDSDYWTNYFLSNKRVAVSSSGTLTVSPAMYSDWMSIAGGFSIYVIATAADGSETSNSIEYTVQPATDILDFDPEYRTKDYYADGEYQLWFRSSSVYNDLTVTSSNPAVAGLIEGIGTNGSGSSTYQWYYVHLYTGVAGTVSITVKENDGSGKSCTATFTVKP